MKNYKRVKDPIYGYIKIPVAYMTYIVDTAVFQRLRRVIQTSYSPLYSSAVHNRFVHSMGVFYLGELTDKRSAGKGQFAYGFRGNWRTI